MGQPVRDVASANELKSENRLKIFVGNLASGAVAGCTVEAGELFVSRIL